MKKKKLTKDEMMDLLIKSYPDDVTMENVVRCKGRRICGDTLAVYVYREAAGIYPGETSPIEAMRDMMTTAIHDLEAVIRGLDEAEAAGRK